MTEYLYWIDKQDQVLGKIERKKAHRQKLLHRAGVVFVMSQHYEVFLTIRSECKSFFPGCIDSACSFHVQYGQSYIEAAQQELQEETQLETSVISVGKFLLDELPDRMMVSVFYTFAEKNLVLDPSEAYTGQYYSFKEAHRLITTKKTTSWLQPAWNILWKNIDL